MNSGQPRAAVWAALDNAPWDLLVIGGGVSGAGVAREAVRSGARVLLLEARDFAYGTSSRSSKMVHGGLRYLAQGQWRVTAESVLERQRLLREAPGLVEATRYVFPHYRGRLRAWGLRLVLAVYDGLARCWRHGWLSKAQTLQRLPGLRAEGLLGAAYFEDSLTDDARLTLRVLHAAEDEGACLLNYVAVTGLQRRAEGWQITLVDAETGAEQCLRARCVINAAGVWADSLRQVDSRAPRLRPLRGSHLLIPAARLPLSSALMLQHPDDGRTLFIYPWAGASVVGTTDLDHRDPLAEEPVISDAELAYLLRAANHLFPDAALCAADIVACWSGVRPVVAVAGRPSAASREHAVWDEDGLITLAGGKLTTFRVMARDALRAAARYVPELQPGPLEPPVLHTPAASPALPAALGRRLAGWYGEEVPAVLAEDATLEPVPGTALLWAELRYACRQEAVLHLDDLLLRRSRLGLLLPHGAEAQLPELERRCRTVLGWDEARWAEEVRRYQAIWRRAYRVPEHA